MAVIKDYNPYEDDGAGPAVPPPPYPVPPAYTASSGTLPPPATPASPIPDAAVRPAGQYWAVVPTSAPPAPVHGKNGYEVLEPHHHAHGGCRARREARKLKRTVACTSCGARNAPPVPHLGVTVAASALLFAVFWPLGFVPLAVHAGCKTAARRKLKKGEARCGGCGEVLPVPEGWQGGGGRCGRRRGGC
ncbi:hypothetical protein DFJ74DRAFT_676014 [Hyaloraphidium curvatum]|nr:hypothetical protein DFJ74DRAFT_676014 [Hyaloraphidium curvatum]